MRFYGVRVLLMVFAGVGFTTAGLLSCGDGSLEGAASDSLPADETSLVAIGDDPDISSSTRPNTIYEYEEFVSAGWKQYQIYDVATLPHAMHARYGFFNQRDIEIRMYADHAAAMEHGAVSAEEAIDRTVHDGSGFASRRIYGSYLVAGNVVMLCELTTSDCVGLLEAVEETP